MTDLIKREDAIEAIQFGISYIKAFNNTTMIRFYERENEALEKAIKRVNELLSVEQDRPIGHWKKEPFPRNKTYYMCSECGRGGIREYSYCPDCGAKME